MALPYSAVYFVPSEPFLAIFNSHTKDQSIQLFNLLLAIIYI